MLGKLYQSPRVIFLCWLRHKWVKRSESTGHLSWLPSVWPHSLPSVETSKSVIEHATFCRPSWLKISVHPLETSRDERVNHIKNIKDSHDKWNEEIEVSLSWELLWYSNMFNCQMSNVNWRDLWGPLRHPKRPLQTPAQTSTAPKKTSTDPPLRHRPFLADKEGRSQFPLARAANTKNIFTATTKTKSSEDKHACKHGFEE